MANLETPDSIRGTRTKLQPGAQNVSVYQGGTRVDVPEPPQDNTLAQLGRALEKFAGGTGVQLSNQAYKMEAARDSAAGEVAAQELAKDRSLKNLNQAVADGRIPAGASPAYNFAMRANFLKLRGEQNQMRMREAYYANTDLRNTDDPDAFIKWAAQQTNENEDAVLKDEKGDIAYSALEIAHSNYRTRVSDGLRGLEQEHIAHRVAERERLGEQAASGLMGIRLETAAANLPAGQRDNEALARALVDVGYNATTGAATYGMDKAKVSAMMQDTIIAKAIAAKDPTYLDIAKAIKVGPESDAKRPSLSDVGRFAAKAQEAREHIASQLYVERQHKETIAMQDSEGTLEQRAAYHGEVYAQTKNEFMKKRLVDNYTNQALNFKNILHLTPKEMDQQRAAMEAIRQVDPQAALSVSSLLLRAKESFQTADNKEHFPLAEMRLHNFILTDPGTPATNRAIDQSLQDKAISGEQWLRLRALSDKSSQDRLKHQGVLNDDSFKRLETAIGRAVNNSPGDPFGAAALHAGAAQLELRQLAVETAEANPGMSALGIARTIEPMMKDIAGKYNETMKEVLDQEAELKKGQDAVVKEALRMTKPAEQVRLAEQVKKAEAQTQVVKEMDKAGKPVTPETLAAEEQKRGLKFGPKNEATFEKWKEMFAKDSTSTDAELRALFKAGKKP